MLQKLSHPQSTLGLRMPAIFARHLGDTPYRRAVATIHDLCISGASLTKNEAGKPHLLTMESPGGTLVATFRPSDQTISSVQVVRGAEELRFPADGQDTRAVARQFKLSLLRAVREQSRYLNGALQDLSKSPSLLHELTFLREGASLVAPLPLTLLKGAPPRVLGIPHEVRITYSPGWSPSEQAIRSSALIAQDFMGRCMFPPTNISLSPIPPHYTITVHSPLIQNLNAAGLFHYAPPQGALSVSEGRVLFKRFSKDSEPNTP